MLYSTSTLQDLCLIKLVQQLEHYSYDLLACLPLTLRRLLLVYLPVVDVCKLENTRVFEDIDAESIWEELFELHIPRYFTSLDNFPPSDMNSAMNDLDKRQDMTFKNKFLSVIANILVGRARPSGYFAALRNYGEIYCERPPSEILAIAPVDVVNCLVAGFRLNPVDVVNDIWEEEEVDNDLIVAAMTDYDSDYKERYEESFFEHERGEHFLDYFAYKETNENVQYIPPRHSGYVDDCRLSDEDAIMLLMEKCGFFPDTLFIPISAYSSNKCPNESLMSQFLINVARLTLSFDKYIEGSTEMRELLSIVLSTSNPMLSTLNLNLDDSLIADSHLLFLAELSGSPGVLASPFQTLQHFSILGRFTASGCSQLGVVISNQPMLASLSVSCTDFSEVSQQFIGALSMLFRNSCFSEATFKNVTFSLKMIQNLIVSFLTAPCMQDQILKFDPVVLTGDSELANESFQQNLTLPESALQYKSLQICIKEFELSSNFGSWLFSIQPSKLKELAVFCIPHFQPWQRESAIKHIDCLPIFANNTSFQVESLSLCIPNGLSATMIQTVFMRDELKKLKILYCSSPINFDDLAENLLKQMPNRMLPEVKIVECYNALIGRIFFGMHTTKTDQSSCVLFCDTMFSMAQLQHLDLELSPNIFHNYSDIIETMYESWKRNGKGRKPKRLVLHLAPGIVAGGSTSQSDDEKWKKIESEMGLTVQYT